MKTKKQKSNLAGMLGSLPILHFVSSYFGFNLLMDEHMDHFRLSQDSSLKCGLPTPVLHHIELIILFQLEFSC